MRTIVFTGGGSAGHVIPNVALIPKLQEEGWSVEYIGSTSGIERTIIESVGGIPRQINMKNNKSTVAPPMKPNSSAIMEKIKSVCGSGR